jgi:DNA-binding SARP family transcriptional activator/glutamine cyclotransferase
VEFRILGRLQVLDGGREVPLGSPKERQLLAVLLLQAGAVVSRARLIEELWGASPPPSAAKALNVHVSQLRKSLARNGDQSIVTRRPGYVLQVGRERLDAARFERLVAEARERVVGDPGSARHLLSEGLALWRGPVLDDVELAAGARNEAGRLEELRLSAQMDRIDCDLGLGLHDQVIGELEALVAEHPLRERLRSQLMLALYRSGQQADALACYREARETLVGELGIEPSVPLQRLERAILNHDPSLEAVSGVARNAPLREERVVAHRPPSRRRRAAAIAMTAGAGIAAGLAVIVGGSSGRNSEAEVVVGDSVVAVDAANERVKAISQLGGSPAALAPAGDSVWTLDTRDAAVSKLDARTGALLRTVSARSAPSGLAVGEGWVWVIGMTHQRGVVVQFDPATGEVANTRLLGPMIPRAVVAGEGGVWIAAELPGRPGVLLRLSPSTAAVVSKLPLPVKPTAIALALGQHEIWISGAAPASRGSAAVSRVALYRVDPATGRIVAHAVLAADPGRSRIAVGPVGLWLSDGRGALLRLDPPTARVVAKTHVPAVPAAIAADDRSLWVIDGSSILWRIDPADGRVRSHARLAPNGRARPTDLAVGSGTIWASFTRVAPAAGDAVRRTVRVGPMRAVSVPVPGTPTRLRFGAGAIWVKSLSAEVTRIDPRTNRVAARITVGSGWGDFAFGFGSVWVTSFDTNTVSRIDPRTNRIVARISTAGLAPMGIAATRDAVWVANHHADPNSRLNRTGSVVRIDPRTNRVVAKIPVGAPDTHGGPDNMTAGARDVWLDIPNQALVVRISASTNRVAARIPVEIGCGHLAAGAGAIWVAEGCSDSIVRIDPESNALIRRITTSANTYPVAFARGSVWATTNDLRLIRIDPASNSIVDSFDITPAARPTGGPWFTVAAGSFWLSDSNRNRVLRVTLPR